MVSPSYSSTILKLDPKKFILISDLSPDIQKGKGGKKLLVSSNSMSS